MKYKNKEKKQIVIFNPTLPFGCPFAYCPPYALQLEYISKLRFNIWADRSKNVDIFSDAQKKMKREKRNMKIHTPHK